MTSRGPFEWRKVGEDYNTKERYAAGQTIWVTKDCRASSGRRWQHFRGGRTGSAYVQTEGLGRFVDSDGDVRVKSDNRWNYVKDTYIFVKEPLKVLLENISAIQQEGFLGVSTSLKEDLNMPVISCPNTNIHKVTFVYQEGEAAQVPATYTATQVAKWEDCSDHYMYIRNDEDDTEDYTCSIQRTFKVKKENLAGVVLYKTTGEISIISLHDSFKPDVLVGLKGKPQKASGEKKVKKSDKHNMEDSHYYAWKEQQEVKKGEV